MSQGPNINEIMNTSKPTKSSIAGDYKFDSLIRAIDFFAQKFNMDMLTDFAGDFINEILTLDSSALFIYHDEDNNFHLKRHRMYVPTITQIPNATKLQDIARFHGSVITRNFNLFFSDAFIDEYKPAMIIPLITSDMLTGFIVTNGKAVGTLDDDDMVMTKAIMQLFNASFERNHFITELTKKDKNLDNKIFELYSVNKASRVLFSEINLDKLLSVGVDIFSEISGSLNTAFAIKEADESEFVVKAYLDVKNHAPCPLKENIALKDGAKIGKDKYIFNIKEERALLDEIFDDTSKLITLDAEYIVIIVKENTLGFVTLGNERLSERYTEEVLELVGSLAISCYIALNNAMMFEQIVRQKAELEQRLNV